MITPITATFPALNFPKEVDYPTQEDWAAFSAAAELNYGILSGEWSDKSEEFKSQTNNLALEIQTIGENAINAISLDTIEDLATYTGTGLVMVKDINRGGTFISKTVNEIDPNTGSLYAVNGGTVFAKLGGGFWARQYSSAVNVKWFDAKGDGVTDDTQSIFNARKNSESIEYPSGNYNISSYQTSGTNVKDSAGKGNVNIKWNYPGAIAWLKFPSGTITKQLNFICTSSITGLRASIEDANNVVIERCHFEGFNDGNINDPSTDAWGLYLKNASSCTILNPTFANNGQSDLCMVDNVSNITVINPQSTSHSGICLNIEPNSLGINTNGAKNINFIGGKFLTVDIKEIENFCYANKDIFFTGSTIDTLNYKGASVSFSNCKITNIIPSSDSIYAGGLNIDNANLSKNILTDPYIFSVNSSGSYGWGTTASGGTYTRVQDGDGKYIRFNSGKLNITFQAFTRDYFPCVANETILIALRNRVDNTGSPDVHTENVIIQFYNSSNVTLSTRSIRCARTLPNTNSGWRNDVALVTSPANSTSFRLFIGKTVASTNTSSVDISAIGVYRITLNVPNGNFNKTLQELFKPVNEKTFYAPYSPLGGAGYFKGERVINSNPTVGQPKAWTCTVDGNPGTWVSEGNL